MFRSDFDYDLPKHLIAQRPSEKRVNSRLLQVRGDTFEHRRFSDLLKILKSDDLLIVNDTVVIKARLRGMKDSGGAVELLVERIDPDLRNKNLALCQVRASKPLKPGRFVLIGEHRLDYVEKRGEFALFRFPVAVLTFLENYGSLPLPPYIDRAISESDENRYQTIFARSPGAVAAPTAGLHFDEDLIKELQKNGIRIASLTLHVGAGTFKPMRTNKLDQHTMHHERYMIPPETMRSVKSCKGRVIAVGTTVVRALESASRTGVLEGETNLFISPGYTFQVIDGLITNFHLPQSTLLMLVAAFAGYERIFSAYETAIDKQYRFFSYGDAMFCERARN